MAYCLYYLLCVYNILAWKQLKIYICSCIHLINNNIVKLIELLLLVNPHVSTPS